MARATELLDDTNTVLDGASWVMARAWAAGGELASRMTILTAGKDSRPLLPDLPPDWIGRGKPHPSTIAGKCWQGSPRDLLTERLTAPDVERAQGILVGNLPAGLPAHELVRNTASTQDCHGRLAAAEHLLPAWSPLPQVGMEAEHA